MKKNLNPVEEFFHGIFLLCGLLSVAFVVGITAYLIISGAPAIAQIGFVEFMTGQLWNPNSDQYGILPFILTSVYGTLGAMVVGIPLGILTALYLSKFSGKRSSRLIRSAVELLAGIPSVVYGLVGMIVLVPAIQQIFNLSSGATLLAAIVVLSIMILPYIVNVSATALDAVPKEYEEGSLALGATETETYFKVSIHAARSGIATAIVQGVGRALGEAMAIIMVAGNVANMPGLFESVRFLTTAIVSEMSYASYGSLHRDALFSIGLVLFAFIVLVNIILNLIARREDK
ncbi:MAG: phosphate ABC transporter permease subunit PstC [Eggerthellales bacterium]|nr:phosphate ABC transporter permease subunit PstC [Eggerthellales bacterium]